MAVRILSRRGCWAARRSSTSVRPGRRAGDRHRGMCGRRVRGFAIDLIPELVRTGRAWGSGAQSPRNRRAVGSL